MRGKERGEETNGGVGRGQAELVPSLHPVKMDQEMTSY